MGCTESRIRTKVDVRDLESSVRTGDIVLFSSKHAAATVTKFFTASTWDHIGLVVKFGAKHVFILEYAGGVYLYPLFTRLYTYYAVQGRVICLRRLLPGQDRAEMQKKIELFVRNVLGRSPPSINEMVMAVLKQAAVVPRLPGSSSSSSSNESADDVVDSLETMFCSKLIAAIFKHVGLLAPHRASADFLPKHFSAPYDGYLDLQKGAILGPELPINFESVSAEIDALRAQIAEDSKWRAEDAVVAANKLYLTMSSGLGTIGEEISKSFVSIERGLHGYSAQAEAAMKRVSGIDPFSSSSSSHEVDVLPVDLTDEQPAEEPTGGGGSAAAAPSENGGVPLRGDATSAMLRSDSFMHVAPDGGRKAAAQDAQQQPLLAR